MSDAGKLIAENLSEVRERVAAAAEKAGRSATDIKIIAVTKYVGAEAVRLLVEAGCRQIAESRPQELWSKAEALAEAEIDWHLVGHLQRNKVRRTLAVPSLAMIHSVDSERLLAAIYEEGTASGKTLPALLEVNISGDESKHGFAPDELERLLPKVSEYDSIQVHGLMTMAHLKGGREVARADFARLRELRDCLAANLPEAISLSELSMGMSDDFEEAILEGATMIRLGRVLFRGLS